MCPSKTVAPTDNIRQVADRGAAIERRIVGQGDSLVVSWWNERTILFYFFPALKSFRIGTFKPILG